MSTETPLTSSKKTKLRKIQKALNSDPVDIGALRKLAMGPGGLINDEVRRKAWPKLLNVDVFDALVKPGNLKEHKYYNQVLLDVTRSGGRFPMNMPDDQRKIMQNQMLEVILWVLIAHPELHYYQGYHDICVTFLLVCGQKLTFRLVEKLSCFYLRDFMDPTMDKTRHILNYLIPIIQKCNIELGLFIVRSGAGTIFALSWLITWYGHVLSDPKQILRLYDFFLACHPLMPIYLAAQIVLYRSEDILKEECDMALVHHLLSKLPVNLPIEELIDGASNLFIQYPPETIAKDAALYYHESLAVSTFRNFELAGYQQRPDYVLRELRKRNKLRKLQEKSDARSPKTRTRRWAVWFVSSAIGAAALAVTNMSIDWLQNF